MHEQKDAQTSTTPQDNLSIFYAHQKKLPNLHQRRNNFLKQNL